MLVPLVGTDTLLCGLMQVRVDFKIWPADAPLAGRVAIPLTMRLVHANVFVTVRPPANVLV